MAAHHRLAVLWPPTPPNLLLALLILMASAGPHWRSAAATLHQQQRTRLLDTSSVVSPLDRAGYRGTTGQATIGWYFQHRQTAEMELDSVLSGDPVLGMAADVMELDSVLSGDPVLGMAADVGQRLADGVAASTVPTSQPGMIYNSNARTTHAGKATAASAGAEPKTAAATAPTGTPAAAAAVDSMAPPSFAVTTGPISTSATVAAVTPAASRTHLPPHRRCTKPGKNAWCEGEVRYVCSKSRQKKEAKNPGFCQRCHFNGGAYFHGDYIPQGCEGSCLQCWRGERRRVQRA